MTSSPQPSSGAGVLAASGISRASESLDAREVDVWASARSFTLRNLAWRLLWRTALLLLAAWTPPPAKAWRRVVLRTFGAKMAEGTNVYGNARVWDPRHLRMERFACLGARVICYNMAPIAIGEYTLVSQGVHLCAGSHDFTTSDFQLVAEPITIGSDVWIAAEAFVGPGVTIGEEAIVGARAVVCSDLPGGHIYIGNPARPLRVRTWDNRRPGSSHRRAGPAGPPGVA